MTVRISGSTGVSGVAGTSGSPALAGDASNVGINFQNEQVNVGYGYTNGVKFDNHGNVQSIGIITAASFVGDITGNLTGNVTGNVTGNLTGNVTGNVTGVATGLTGSPNITVDNLTVENSAFTAISTTDINKTIVNREFTSAVGVGTTADITITLPASPQPGWLVGVGVAGTFTDTIVARNGSNIMGVSEDMTIDVAHLNVSFLYVDSTIGWKVI